MTVNFRETLRECLVLLLRPVARFCVQRSLHLPDFIEAAKQAFLLAAQEEIQRCGAQPSASRISVMTGIHRRDVTRLWRHGEVRTDNIGILTRVIGAWQLKAPFQDRSGEAKVLDCDGRESSFAELVRSVSKDLNPYTVLFELERIGAVKRELSKVLLCSQVATPRGDAVEGFRLLSADCGDLISAVQQNVLSDVTDLPNLHVKTQFDNIAPQHMTKIKEWFLEQGDNLHREARRFLGQFDRDLNAKATPHSATQTRIRAVLGSFSFVEQDFQAHEPKKKETGR